jgi:hypothetical protein
MTRHSLRRGLGAGLGAACLAGAAIALAAPPAAAEGPDDCSQSSPGFHKPCIEAPVVQPGSEGRPGDTDREPQGPGNSRPASPYQCRWVNYRDQSALASLHPDAPPGSVLQEWICWNNGRQVYGPYVTRAAPPDQGMGPAPPPSPAVVAETLMIRAEGLLRQPEVIANPAVGRASIVDVPTFVAVTNWQRTVHESDCAVGVCVDLTATPTLTFDPGEPGSEVVECDPPGTRFERGGDATAQAEAAGACAHTYRRRTGVHGRPDAWPGVVTVTWEISWTSNVGPSGTFDPVELSADLPRSVDEVSALVVDSDVGG